MIANPSFLTNFKSWKLEPGQSRTRLGTCNDLKRKERLDDTRNDCNKFENGIASRYMLFLADEQSGDQVDVMLTFFWFLNLQMLKLVGRRLSQSKTQTKELNTLST